MTKSAATIAPKPDFLLRLDSENLMMSALGASKGTLHTSHAPYAQMSDEELAGDHTAGHQLT